MIYKNAELYNVSEIETDDRDGSIKMYRMPKRLSKIFEGENGEFANSNSTGVEIRFVINSGNAIIRMKSACDKSVNAAFHIFRGGIQGSHEINTYVPVTPTDFEFGKAGNIDTLRAMAQEAGDSFDPEVIRIIFDRGAYRIIDISGDIKPPSIEQTPEKTLLCYGSSITHGSNSIDRSHSWTALTAHSLNMDLRNLGMPGCCALEPEVIDYIASEGERSAWDIAVLELGINVLFWEKRKIGERVLNTVKQVAGRNKDKPVYVISPVYCGDDFKGKAEPMLWRRIIRKTVAELGYKNVIHIDGLELLDKMTLLSADEIHPNIYGVQQIAERLTKRIKENLKDG